MKIELEINDETFEIVSTTMDGNTLDFKTLKIEVGYFPKTVVGCFTPTRIIPKYIVNILGWTSKNGDEPDYKFNRTYQNE